MAASTNSRKVRLVADLGDLGGDDRVAVWPGDGLVARDPGVEKPREDPARELVGVDLRDVLEALNVEVVPHRRREKGRPIVERLGVRLGALDEFDLVLRRDLDVKDQAVAGQKVDHRRLFELAQTAAHVIDEVVVAVDLMGLPDEGRDIHHGGDLALAVQGLAPTELLHGQPPQVRIAELADEAQDWTQVVHLDVVADQDPVAPQQVLEEGDLHRLGLDDVEDVLVQVAGPDAVIPGVVEPVVAPQQGREMGLAHPGHAKEGDGAILPMTELFDAELHRAGPRCTGAGNGTSGPAALATGMASPKAPPGLA